MTKIKDIKTTIYKWTGEIVPPAQNFCTNPTDILKDSGDKMKSSILYGSINEKSKLN